MPYFQALILLLFVSLAESFEYFFFSRRRFGGYGGYGEGDYHGGSPHQEENYVPEPDYYADLGVSSTATAREIKRKYQVFGFESFTRTSKKSQTQETQERFQRVQAAYAVLSNPEKQGRLRQYWPFNFLHLDGIGYTPWNAAENVSMAPRDF